VGNHGGFCWRERQDRPQSEATCPSTSTPRLKQLIQDYPADWLRILGLPAAPLELLDADLSTITTEADKVLRADLPAPWLLHFELQSSQDAGLAQRLLRYDVLLTTRHDLPTHSAVILRRPAAAGINGLVERALPEQAIYLTFRYQVVRLWEMPVESQGASSGWSGGWQD
jgi:hypothetical protein